MSPDDPLPSIEQRLRREADGLLESYGDLPPPATFLDAHRKRRRRRARLVVGCAVAASFLVVALSRMLPWSPNELTPGIGQPIVADNRAVDDQLDSIATRQESIAELAFPEEVPNALPILLVDWDATGDFVITPGYYVVEPSEILTLEELTPGERYAVQQVLGTDESGLFTETL